jgi:hypothetical protein
MSNNTINIKDLEKSKGKAKTGSKRTANVFHDPDRYGTEEQKEETKAPEGF